MRVGVAGQSALESDFHASIRGVGIGTQAFAFKGIAKPLEFEHAAVLKCLRVNKLPGVRPDIY
jgi:hypothetical protein